jgi:outer membrane protein W
MKRSLVNLALVILLLLSVTAVAQEYEDEERDFLEFSFYGGLGIPSGGISNWQDSLGAKTGWQLGMDAGYFLTSNLVLGLNFTYMQFAVDNTNEASLLHHRLFNPAIYLKYYFFGESNFVPYLKGHAGVDNPKFATLLTELPQPAYRELSYDPGFAFGFGAGAFYYTSDYSGLFLEVDYHMGLTDTAEKDYGGTVNVFGENIGLINIRGGLSVYFSAGD